MDNHTLKECYFGVTDDPKRKVKEQCAAYAKTVSHWKHEVHEIKIELLSEHDSQELAVKTVRVIEKIKKFRPEGYKMLTPSGL